MSFNTGIKIIALALGITLTLGFLVFNESKFPEDKPATSERALTIPELDPSVVADLENQIQREIAVKESSEVITQAGSEATTTDEKTTDAKATTTPEPEPNSDQPDQPIDTIPAYITVADSCGPNYEGECLRVRSAPSTQATIQSRVRNGQTLKVEDYIEADGRWWYKIAFDEWLRYPDRLDGDWYVAAEFVEPVPRESLVEPTASAGEKRIVVNLTEQMLYAYEGDELFMEEPVSTGKLGAATPRGTFSVFYRTPSRYMQGPLPGITDDDYDLPGVPWNLYFTQQGAVIHGAYWHDKFGQHWSHGCVNLPPEKAQKLYSWTPEGTEVVVKD